MPRTHLTDRMKEIIKYNIKISGKSEKDVIKTWTDQIPLGRMGTPCEFAILVVFLVFERASYIIGKVIQVDDGFVKSSF